LKVKIKREKLNPQDQDKFHIKKIKKIIVLNDDIETKIYLLEEEIEKKNQLKNNSINKSS